MFFKWHRPKGNQPTVWAKVKDGAWQKQSLSTKQHTHQDINRYPACSSKPEANHFTPCWKTRPELHKIMQFVNKSQQLKVFFFPRGQLAINNELLIFLSSSRSSNFRGWGETAINNCRQHQHPAGKENKKAEPVKCLYQGIWMCVCQPECERWTELSDVRPGAQSSLISVTRQELAADFFAGSERKSFGSAKTVTSVLIRDLIRSRQASGWPKRFIQGPRGKSKPPTTPCMWNTTYKIHSSNLNVLIQQPSLCQVFFYLFIRFVMRDVRH